MNYKAITTLKKADADGRIPQHTLDQYVRSDLAFQLMKALTPTLSIDRVDQGTSSANPATSLMVDFTTELFILNPCQWQHLKDSLSAAVDALPMDQQRFIQRLIDEVETTQLSLP
ncbi:hypothetical protein [Spirosoma radiotolerans]|uniref:Uncharacterized protein n=1 Tax=Spirosoma radiotolerans TaxID=1379870 RepID=A0A0E3ZVK9_9BACT|nr:hypothetical protein [Spirosoma radiotolerans]AKD55099.1 hypothetical protein SD10_09460 [Spirosoma radiotolerans]